MGPCNHKMLFKLKFSDEHIIYLHGSKQKYRYNGNNQIKIFIDGRQNVPAFNAL